MLLCRWQGSGVDEVGIEEGTDKVRIQVDPRYYRPTEVVCCVVYLYLTFYIGFLLNIFISHWSFLLILWGSSRSCMG